MASIWQIFRLRSPSIYDYSSPMFKSTVDNPDAKVALV